MEGFVKLYDFDGYVISKHGVIRSLDREVIKKNGTKLNLTGQELTIRKVKLGESRFVEVRGTDGVKKTIYVLKAVAEHFTKKPSSLHIYVTPKDGDYTNLSVDNVKWITHKQLMAKRLK